MNDLNSLIIEGEVIAKSRLGFDLSSRRNYRGSDGSLKTSIIKVPVISDVDVCVGDKVRIVGHLIANGGLGVFGEHIEMRKRA